jgi:hypothetical protein
VPHVLVATVNSCRKIQIIMKELGVLYCCRRNEERLPSRSLKSPHATIALHSRQTGISISLCISWLRYSLKSNSISIKSSIDLVKTGYHPFSTDLVRNRV